MNKHAHIQDGFTIVELMIATTVLSILLLLATVIITNIGSLYTKGINQSRTQDNVRSIVDQVTQDLEYTSASPIHLTFSSGPQKGEEVYCIGNARYTLVKNLKAGNSLNSQSLQDVLWRDSIAPTDCSLNVPVLTTNPPSTNGNELIAPNSFLTEFSISASSPYDVQISTGYGDPTDPTLITLSGLNSSCTGNTGDQYCATASSDTTVVKRIN